MIEKIQKLFGKMDRIYVADGHHRAAAAVKIAQKRRKENPDYTGKESFNYFLSVLFPWDELRIIEYNRVVKDLGGKTVEEFLKEVEKCFQVEREGACPVKPEKKGKPGIFSLFEQEGYTVARGYEDYKAKAADAEKMILIQEEDADQGSLPYATDRKPGDLTLAQITESAIDFLTKGKDKGFFLMVEGGKIDWACHSNDAATAFREVMDLDAAVQVAYEFYKKHPKETLIVITADHETGGIALGTGKYALNLQALQYQKHSVDGLSARLSQFRKEQNNEVTWDEMQVFLGEEMGFWKEVPITWKQERELRDEFEESFVKNKVKYAESMYSKSEPLAACAKEILNDIAMVSWASGGHSAGYVPVFASGAGSELFGEKIDNTEIPKRIAKAARYK